MKLTFLASSLFVVAACGGKSKPAGPGPDNGGGTSGPPYASMFVQGTSWTFDVHTEDSGEGDDGNIETNTDDVQATCTVASVRELGGMKIAEITCDDHWPTFGSSVGGTWVATDKGVWNSYEWMDESVPPTLDDAMMVMGATPVARTEHIGDPEMEDFATDITVEQQGDTWCWSETSSGGDAGWSSICFDAAGPTEGEFGWSGGSDHDAKFTRVK